MDGNLSQQHRAGSALHENEIAVWAWSTTDEDSMLFSLECGADALMGDDAPLIMEVLNRMRPV